MGWPRLWKNDAASEAAHPPPSSTMAITPPPGMPLGHLYAAHKLGTLQGTPAMAAGMTTPGLRSLK